MQAILNAVTGSLVMLIMRLEIQRVENLQPQQPVFKAGICLPPHKIRPSAYTCHVYQICSHYHIY